MSTSSWLQLGVLSRSCSSRPACSAPTSLPSSGAARRRGDRVFLPVERVIYRVCGVDPTREQTWPVYAFALLAFSLVSVLGLYLLQRVQGFLPLDPTDAKAVPPALAFNTAVSFVTNTNWQNYGGELTMSHLTQMAGLAVQNFVSAAVGLAVAVALIRGSSAAALRTIGNFWVDLTRGTIRVLLPLAIVIAIVLASQGVVQNLHGFTHATTVQGVTQSIPGGPIASQEAIKELGENGGGPFNANSAHPFENSNGFTNLFEILVLLMIPFALTYTYGRLVKDQRQGWVLFAVMFAIWIGAAGFAMHYEDGGNPKLQAIGAGRRQHGGQGDPLRHSDVRPVRRLDDGHLDGRRELRPRQLYAARRRGPARAHDARRGQPRRHRSRSLRDPCLRAARRSSSPG